MFNLFACLCFMFCGIRLCSAIMDCVNKNLYCGVNLAFALAELAALMALIFLGAR